MAVKLTEYEQRMLGGEFGRAKQLALEKIIDYAQILGAEELVEITKGHICIGSPHANRGPEFRYDDWYTKRYLDPSGQVQLEHFNESTFIIDDVNACDGYQWEYANQTKAFFDGNRSMMQEGICKGACNGSTCAPYLSGWLPMPGEYFVTVESSNVLFCNSIWGARGNGGGSPTTFLSLVCGRAPKWGLHLDENRKGTHVFNIQCASENKTDWDLMGYAIGKRLAPNAIPVLRGDFKRPNLGMLKSFFTALATTSGAEMCLIVGVSPEARTYEDAMGGRAPVAEYNITQEVVDGYRRWLCHQESGPVDFLQIGCPNSSCEELAYYARYMDGKHTAPGVKFCIFTNLAQYRIAELSGIIERLRISGVEVLTSGCILRTIGLADKASAIGLSAAKLTHYSKTEREVPIYFGTDEEVMDAAVKGYWEVR